MIKNLFILIIIVCLILLILLLLLFKNKNIIVDFYKNVTKNFYSSPTQIGNKLSSYFHKYVSVCKIDDYNKYIIVGFYKNITRGFFSSPTQIGNTLSSYFHKYALSVCNKKDFTCKTDDYNIIKYLPEFIPFDSNIYDQFQKCNINSNKINFILSISLWHCDKEWIFDFWKILKPTIHKILDNAIQKNNLKNNIIYPIIHFRCADTPFIKHNKYYLQRYSFFKEALGKVTFNDNDRTVIIMNYLKHRSDNESANCCNKYLNNLVKYISDLGYTCILQSKSSFEDFSDLFNAPYVISTGGSFSFMSGFFGHGTFISTEHCQENNNCCKNCGDIFLPNYNIHHKLIKSYYDVDNVEKHRNS